MFLKSGYVLLEKHNNVKVLPPSGFSGCCSGNTRIERPTKTVQQYTAIHARHVDADNTSIAYLAETLFFQQIVLSRINLSRM